MNRLAMGFALFALSLLTASPASSQWLKIPLPGTPRTPDGKPNLTAPAPKTPDGKTDLSGIWRRDTPGVNYLVNLGAGGAEISMRNGSEPGSVIRSGNGKATHSLPRLSASTTSHGSTTRVTRIPTPCE